MRRIQLLLLGCALFLMSCSTSPATSAERPTSTVAPATTSEPPTTTTTAMITTTSIPARPLTQQVMEVEFLSNAPQAITRLDNGTFGGIGVSMANIGIRLSPYGVNWQPVADVSIAGLPNDGFEFTNLEFSNDRWWATGVRAGEVLAVSSLDGQRWEVDQTIVPIEGYGVLIEPLSVDGETLVAFVLDQASGSYSLLVSEQGEIRSFDGLRTPIHRPLLLEDGQLFWTQVSGDGGGEVVINAGQGVPLQFVPFDPGMLLGGEVEGWRKVEELQPVALISSNELVVAVTDGIWSLDLASLSWTSVAEFPKLDEDLAAFDAEISEDGETYWYLVGGELRWAKRERPVWDVLNLEDSGVPFLNQRVGDRFPTPRIIYADNEFAFINGPAGQLVRAELLTVS